MKKKKKRGMTTKRKRRRERKERSDLSFDRKLRLKKKRALREEVQAQKFHPAPSKLNEKEE